MSWFSENASMEFKDKPRSSWSWFPPGLRSSSRWKRRTLGRIVVYGIIVMVCFVTFATLLGGSEIHEEMLQNQSANSIRLPKLTESLKNSAPRFRRRTKNILFVAYNVQQASQLAGIACEAGRFGKVNPHFLILGDMDVPLEFFQSANGVSADACGSFTIHDGRPEASMRTKLSPARVTATALHDSFLYLAPQAVMYLKSDAPWFVQLVEAQSASSYISKIGIPSGSWPDLHWITRLDAKALLSWDRPKIDILIIGNEHTGSLARLLGSLETADYFGSARPRIILDLDPSIDVQSKILVAQWQWPSEKFLRHRVSNSVNSKVNIVESWYPNTAHDSFLLVLDGSEELSHFYFHWLRFALLSYCYSYDSRDPYLMGISLDTPSRYINGTTPFLPPSTTSPFLYQAPPSRSVLFSPDHWREFHDYVNRRIQVVDASRFNNTDVAMDPSVRSSWLEYLIELVNVRGYLFLYPPSLDGSFAALHNEQEPLDTKAPEEHEVRTGRIPLEQLPDGDLPKFESLITLDLNGVSKSWDEISEAAQKYKEIISTCPASDENQIVFGVSDLFCDTMDM